MSDTGSKNTLEEDGVPVTMWESAAPNSFSLSFDRDSIFLSRRFTMDWMKMDRVTAISINRRTLCSIRVDEGPDYRTAMILGTAGGVVGGISGTFLGYVISQSGPLASMGGFGGFITGFGTGFGLSLSRFRVASVQINSPYDRFLLWTNPDNVSRLRPLLRNPCGQTPK